RRPQPVRPGPGRAEPRRLGHHPAGQRDPRPPVERACLRPSETARRNPMSFDVLAEGLQFPEGPIAMPDGSVILVEIARGTLSRVWNGKTEVVCDLGGGPNGAAFGPDGAVYVCNNGGFAWHEIQGLMIPGNAAKDYTTGR